MTSLIRPERTHYKSCNSIIELPSITAACTCDNRPGSHVRLSSGPDLSSAQSESLKTRPSAKFTRPFLRICAGIGAEMRGTKGATL